VPEVLDVADRAAFYDSTGAVLGGHPLPPYVRLIHDVLLGDRSLFTRPDGLEHVWQVAGALLADKPEPVIYPKGSWGPAKADRLAEPIGWLLRSSASARPDRHGHPIWASVTTTR
jgi:glucose-6-phosphate dehydrogenase-like protein